MIIDTDSDNDSSDTEYPEPCWTPDGPARPGPPAGRRRRPATAARHPRSYRQRLLGIILIWMIGVMNAERIIVTDEFVAYA